MGRWKEVAMCKECGKVYPSGAPYICRKCGGRLGIRNAFTKMVAGREIMRPTKNLEIVTARRRLFKWEMKEKGNDGE